MLVPNLMAIHSMIVKLFYSELQMSTSWWCISVEAMSSMTTQLLGQFVWEHFMPIDFVYVYI